jgi:hypothetical protein
MTAPVIVWVFMILMQQEGFNVTVVGNLDECKILYDNEMNEAKARGSEIIASAQCTAVTLTPPAK